MAIREILTAPDPRLKLKSKLVEGGVSDTHRKLMDDMLETMYAAPGIGLAAIQIGEPLRIIKHLNAVKGDRPVGFGENRVDSIAHAIDRTGLGHVASAGIRGRNNTPTTGVTIAYASRLTSPRRYS